MLQAKIIDEPIFVGLVVMTVVTILMAGPLMKYYLGKEELALKAKGNEPGVTAPIASPEPGKKVISA